MTPPNHSLPDVLRQQRLAVATVLTVVVLAGVNWILSPEQAERWLSAMLVLPLICLVLSLWYLWMRRSRPPVDDDAESAAQRYFGATLTLVVLAIGIRQVALFGLEIWVQIGDHRADLEFERRILGLSTAAVFVFVGNALPKLLTPLSILPLHLAERVTRARRFVGAVWFVLGLVLGSAFLTMPVTFAKGLAGWFMIAGLLSITSAVVWMNLSHAGRER